MSWANAATAEDDAIGPHPLFQPQDSLLNVLLVI